MFRFPLVEARIVTILMQERVRVGQDEDGGVAGEERFLDCASRRVRKSERGRKKSACSTRNDRRVWQAMRRRVGRRECGRELCEGPRRYRTRRVLSTCNR